MGRSDIWRSRWRRRRDSNPRDPSGPTPLAGERLRPLGHVSADRYTRPLVRIKAVFDKKQFFLHALRFYRPLP